MSVVTSTPFIICLAVLGACIFAIVVLDIAGYVPQARELLARQQHTGQHAVKGKRSHVKTGPGPAREDRDPFADLDDGSSDDEEAAAGHFASLRDPGPEGAPALSAPVPQPAPAGTETPAETAPPVAAALEPLPGRPPLEVRTPGAVIPADGVPECKPVDRGTLATIRDALKAWTPAPAVPQEPVTAPELVTAGDDTQEIFLGLVGGTWDPAGMADRIEAEVYGDIAPKGGGEKKADFAGVSVAGLPDDGWDLSAPVLSLPGGTVPEVTP